MTSASLSRRFVRLSFAHPFWILAVFLLVGVGSYLRMSRLTLRGSFIELLPEKAKEVQDLELVSRKAGGDGYLVLQVTGVPAAQLRRFADQLAPALEKLPEVRYVEYRYDREFFRTRALLLLPVERLRALRHDVEARILFEKQRAHPLYADLSDAAPALTLEEIEKKYASDVPQSAYIESRDGQELYLFIKPTGTAADLEFTRRRPGPRAAVEGPIARMTGTE